jgi:hypothetical protein
VRYDAREPLKERSLEEVLRQIAYATPKVAFLLGMALLLGERLNKPIETLKRFLDSLTEYPYLCYALVGLTTLTTLALSTLLTGIPFPGVHDEFSYLLSADTLAHGRLSNPTPLFWEHYETFHALLNPVYMSKYPLGQGFFLAIGQLLWHPILGVWLSAILASVALYGMLRVWLAPYPRRWALIGGLLFSIQPITMRWTHNYWGGCVAVFGGGLLFGNVAYLLHALAKETDNQKASLRNIRLHAFGMGFGIFVLANSRPFEGATATFCTLVALCIALRKRLLKQDRTLLLPILIPLIICIIGTILEIGYCNYRTLGKPFTLPYLVHEKTYGAAPQFVWQAPPTPVTYHHPRMEQFYLQNDAHQYYLQRTLKGFLRFNLEKIGGVITAYYYDGFLLLLILLLPLLLRRHKEARFAVISIGVCLFGFLFVKSQFVHYMAPILCLFLYLLYLALEALKSWVWRGRRIGKPFVFMLLIAYFVQCWYQIYTLPFAEEVPFPYRRAMIVRDLKAKGGQHLILVRYTSRHDVNMEWVYNEADIENAPVVWATDMGQEANRALLEHFHNRQIWSLNADDYHWELLPFFSNSH